MQVSVTMCIVCFRGEGAWEGEREGGEEGGRESDYYVHLRILYIVNCIVNRWVVKLGLKTF